MSRSTLRLSGSSIKYARMNKSRSRNATTPAVHKNQRRCRVSPSQSGIGLLLIILFYRIAEQLHPGVVTGVVRGGTYRIRITKNLTLARTTLQPEQKLRSGLTE